MTIFSISGLPILKTTTTLLRFRIFHSLRLIRILVMQVIQCLSGASKKSASRDASHVIFGAGLKKGRPASTPNKQTNNRIVRIKEIHEESILYFRLGFIALESSFIIQTFLTAFLNPASLKRKVDNNISPRNQSRAVDHQFSKHHLYVLII